MSYSFDLGLKHSFSFMPGAKSQNRPVFIILDILKRENDYIETPLVIKKLNSKLSNFRQSLFVLLSSNST